MNFCVAGRYSIAIKVADYLRHNMPQVHLLALPGVSDTGIDAWQPSFLKYVCQHADEIVLTTLDDLYQIEDLVFLSLEYDKLIDVSKFRSRRLYNVHFSLLPAYKGCYTSAWPILNGEKESGVTLHKIDSGIDTGDIIAQSRIPLGPTVTAESLYLQYIKVGVQLAIDNLPLLISNDQVLAEPQLSFGSSYYSRGSIDYKNLKISLCQTAAQIDAQIRAYYFPFYQIPVVLGYRIVKSEITDSRSTRKAGTLIKDTASYVMVATIDYDMILYKETNR